MKLWSGAQSLAAHHQRRQPLRFRLAGGDRVVDLHLVKAAVPGEGKLVGDQMSARTQTAKGSPAAFLALSSGSSHVSVLMLTVVNATAEDTGAFACVADNGVGSQADRNTTYLLVRREWRGIN